MTKHLLSREWVSALVQYNNLFVGYSGGLDSTALLHALNAEPLLRSHIKAVHINHGISPNALVWQNHCEQFCKKQGILFIDKSVYFEHNANLEEQARIARYAAFSSLLSRNDCLLLGHHLDDQAETVFLQLFRGAGVDGLAAMQDKYSLGEGALLRPLLQQSRSDLEHYAKVHGLTWIDDESNWDARYSRNYLRHEIIPLITKRWPGVKKNLARTASHMGQAKRNLEDLAVLDCKPVDLSEPILNLEFLEGLSEERIANILRVWFKKNQRLVPSSLILQSIIREVLFASPDAMPLVSCDDIQVRRYQNMIYLTKGIIAASPTSFEWQHFPAPLHCHSHQLAVIATKASEGLSIEIGSRISVAFRKGGERMMWHGQTKQLKKLLQEWGIPPWLRDQIPLLFINGELAAVVGYAVSDVFFTRNASQAWQLMQQSL